MTDSVVSATTTAHAQQRSETAVRPRVRRLVLGLGVVLTLAAAFGVHRIGGSFWSEIRVVFLAPQSPVTPNTLAVTPTSVITTAGVVARMVDPDVEAVVSSDVTLTGEGIRHGFEVRLPNTGGQWANNFDQPVLDVQAVGSTPAEVRSTMRTVLFRVRAALDSLQDQQRVAASKRITLDKSPSDIPMYYQAGSHVRALLATLTLGAALSAAAARATSVLVVRRGRYRTPVGSKEELACRP